MEWLSDEFSIDTSYNRITSEIVWYTDFRIPVLVNLLSFRQKLDSGKHQLRIVQPYQARVYRRGWLQEYRFGYSLSPHLHGQPPHEFSFHLDNRAKRMRMQSNYNLRRNRDKRWYAELCKVCVRALRRRAAARASNFT